VPSGIDKESINSIFPFLTTANCGDIMVIFTIFFYFSIFNFHKKLKRVIPEKPELPFSKV
ncbi:MAG: hypothetical protein ACKN9K_16930, partial [Dolichospermum sp.]